MRNDLTVAEAVRLVDALPAGTIVDAPRGRFVREGASWMGFMGSREVLDSERLVSFGPDGCPVLPRVV